MDTGLDAALRDLLAARLGSRAAAEDVAAAVAESSLLAREVALLRPCLGPADAPDGLVGLLAAS
jgi:hypothetical protein